MTFLETWVQTPLAEALGWTLVHFLWEGVIVALALAAALCVIRSSCVRHAAACLAMLAMLAGFGLTFARLMPQQQVQGATTAKARAIPPAPNGFEEHGRVVKGPAWNRAADFLPWLAPFWIAGVLICHLRTLASWMAARRLRRTGVCGAPDLWQERLNRLGARVRLSRPVTLLESCLADVPVVIGYVRPVILMPVGLLAGLPAGQIESILLHELAHIRRCDYLVNLLQTFVEGLLFYHPAVWWISGVIRAERENCCDDLVVATNGDAHEYAVALAALEQNRWAAREAALAATGGSLVKRIRRLLDQPEGPRAALTPVLSAGILAITAAVALAAWQSKPADNSPRPVAPVAPAAAAPVAAHAPVAPPAAKPQVKLLAQVQQAPAPRPAASPYSKWLNEDVAYIITGQERAVFNSLLADEERDRFIEQFWLRHDPTPGTPENEFKEEHYRRIAYSNERFRTPNIHGWKTDRGRVYITWGPPDEIESHPSGGVYIRPPEEGGGQTTTYRFEQWRYRHIDGVGNDIDIEFVDKTRSGDYRMTTDPHEKDRTPYVPGQSGGNVFFSTEPGSKVTVEITPDRKRLVSIPIDFDAAQYSITGTTRASDGRKNWGEFRRVLSLCKDSPGAFGCLERPVFQPAPSVMGRAALEPGSYVFQVVVKDSTGTIQKTYTVNFQLN